MANSKIAHGHCNYAKADKLVVCHKSLLSLTPISQFDPRALITLTCSSMSESHHQKRMKGLHPSRQGAGSSTRQQGQDDQATQALPTQAREPMNLLPPSWAVSFPFRQVTYADSAEVLRVTRR
jgi:hypothetical protein